MARILLSSNQALVKPSVFSKLDKVTARGPSRRAFDRGREAFHGVIEAVSDERPLKVRI